MTTTTTTTDEPRRCGYPNFRCAGCESATAAPLDVCPRCGSSDIQPSTCRRILGAGVVRCYLHGGRTPQVAAAATTRVVETKLAALLEEYDVGPCVDPLQASLDLAGQAVAWKDLLGDRVAQLAADEWRYEGRTGEQVRAELVLFERAVDRCARILADVGRLNLEERLLAFHSRIEQAQANAWGDTLEQALDETLPADLADAAKRRFGARLRATVTGTDLPPLAEVPRYVRVDSIDVTAGPAERPPEPPKAIEAVAGPDVPLDAPEPVQEVVSPDEDNSNLPTVEPPLPSPPPAAAPSPPAITREDVEFMNRFGLGLPREDR